MKDKLICFLTGHIWELDKYSICLRCHKQYDDTFLKHKFVKVFGGTFESSYTKNVYCYAGAIPLWFNEMKFHLFKRLPKLMYYKIRRFLIMKCRLGRIKARVDFIKTNIINFLWFQKRAWANLFGKETIVDGREVESNGGFKYNQINLTLIPFNKEKIPQ